jgi:hypothetical protein
MKTKLLYSSLACAALSFAVCRADDESIGQKTENGIRIVKDKTVEAGQSVVAETKKAAEAVKDAVTPSSDARKVDVTLKNHFIEIPRDLAAGKTAFVVHNAGKEPQNFKIEGQGIDKSFLLAIDPSDTKTFEVDLRPGDYKVFVPGKDSAGNDEVGVRVK